MQGTGIHQEYCVKLLKNIQFICQKANTPLPSSITDFLISDSFIKKNKGNIIQENSASKNLFEAHIWRSISLPLTVLYAMEKNKLEVNSSFILHVIGSNLWEAIGIKWELILYWLPNLKNLKVVFIGPLLKSEYTSKISLCKRFRNGTAKLNFELYEGFYQDYKSNGQYLKPNIAVAANAGIHVYDSWIPAIKILVDMHSPFIITAFNNYDAYNDHMYIKEHLPYVKYLSSQCNPFASIFIFRNDYLNCACAENEIITIYDAQ